MLQPRTLLQCFFRDWNPGRDYYVCIFYSLDNGGCIGGRGWVFGVCVCEGGREGWGGGVDAVEADDVWGL